MKYALPTHRSRTCFGRRSLLVLIDPLCVVVWLALKYPVDKIPDQKAEELAYKEKDGGAERGSAVET